MRVLTFEDHLTTRDTDRNAVRRGDSGATHHSDQDDALKGARSLHVVQWPDPVVDKIGHDPRSLYVEKFWLPVIGPSCLWLLRSISSSLDASPEGFELDFDLTARQIGLGGRSSRHSPFQRTVRRLISYELATLTSHDRIAVRRFMPQLSPRNVGRLDRVTRESHRQWLDTIADIDPAVTNLRWRARRLALGLIALGDDRASVETEMLAWRLHPAHAWDAAEWAWRHHIDKGREIEQGREIGQGREIASEALTAPSVTSISPFRNAQFTEPS
jgi:hypothetical protein